jgi:hypothetical protein
VHHRCFSRGFEETTSSTKALFVGASSVRLLSLVGALCENSFFSIFFSDYRKPLEKKNLLKKTEKMS